MRVPFWGACDIYQRDFSPSMAGGILTTPSCYYCWHLMEQERKWKIEGTVEAAPSGQSLQCHSLIESIFYEPQVCTWILSQSNAFPVKRDSLDVLKKKQQNKTKTTHKNQYELKHKQRVLITVLLSP